MLAAGVHDCYSMALHEICILLLPAGVLEFICYNTYTGAVWMPSLLYYTIKREINSFALLSEKGCRVAELNAALCFTIACT